jgi:hypothetical protein
MDPLSVAASVVGILAAAGKVLGILSDVADAPQSVKDLRSEVEDIRLIFSSLAIFLDRLEQLDHRRSIFIQLGDFVAILTRTVITFSELETLVQPFCTTRRMAMRQRVTWRWQQTAAKRLVNQLQRHKVSLSLMLQIYQWYGSPDKSTPYPARLK